MTEVHKVVCGRCEKEKNLEISVFDENKYEIPKDWIKTRLDFCGTETHLCPECYRKKLAAMELFMYGKIEQSVDLTDEELQANIKKENGDL